MAYKGYNPFTGKVETISKEDKVLLDALKDQFEQDAQELLAEREIVKEILNNYLKIDQDEDVCKD